MIQPCYDSKLLFLAEFLVYYDFFFVSIKKPKHIGDVMVIVLVSSTTSADREFEHRSSQTNDYEIGFCCFSAKHSAIRRKSKD